MSEKPITKVWGQPSAYDAPSEVREVDYANLSASKTVAPEADPDRPVTKVARHGLAWLGIAAFVFALVCAGSIKSSAMHRSIDGGAWLFLLAALAVAVILWLAAGSDKLQPSINLAADKSLDAAAAALRSARTVGQQVKGVASEIDHRSRR